MGKEPILMCQLTSVQNKCRWWHISARRSSGCLGMPQIWIMFGEKFILWFFPISDPTYVYSTEHMLTWSSGQLLRGTSVVDRRERWPTPPPTVIGQQPYKREPYTFSHSGLGRNCEKTALNSAGCCPCKQSWNLAPIWWYQVTSELLPVPYRTHWLTLKTTKNSCPGRTMTFATVYTQIIMVNDLNFHVCLLHDM